MLRYATTAARRQLTRALATSPQPLQRDPLSILKTIADAVPSSLMKMTSADWLLRLTVLARHNSSRPSESSPSATKNATESSLMLNNAQFLRELQYYVRVCDAIYASSQDRFMRESLLAQGNVTIVQSHQGGVFAPKYYVYVDHDRRTIVLVIRGSASIQDFVTDMCMHHEPFLTGYGHRGIVHAANWMDWKLRDDMLKLAAEYRTYNIRLTGHSLGAGTAALLAHLWSSVIPRMHCIAFAPPACLTLDLAQACESHVTSVILGDDCVPRLSGANLVTLLDEVEQFEVSTALKAMVAEELQAKAKQTQDSAGVRQLRQAIDRVESLKKTASENLATKISAITPPSVNTLSWLEDKPFATELKQLWKQLDQRKESQTTDKRWVQDKPFAAELKALWEQVDTHLGRTEQFLSLDPRQLPVISAWPFKLSDQNHVEWRKRMDFIASMPSHASSKQLISLWGNLDVTVIAMEGLVRFVNDPDRKKQLVSQIEGLLRQISTTRSAFSSLAPLLDPMSNRFYELLIATKHTVQQTNWVLPMSSKYLSFFFSRQAPYCFLRSFKAEASPRADLSTKPARPSSQLLQNKILSMVDSICADLRRETDSIIQLGKSTMTNGDANTALDDIPQDLLGMEPVFPPGKVIVVDSSGNPPALTHVPDVGTYFNRIVVSNDMIMDHLSSTYDEVIGTMLETLDRPPQEG
ncbi:hypothetical protein, variant 2 [Aphanomyces invadans]|uniref:Fungal lipase-type domain-containing protein n=1 Tax=Aphanomyces invadans TaxID=157072 RepID=A0A024UMI3_9STRA|nr:hypothetical protein, variant 2 [Aphanomyces invadans]ETW07375.1 hypothetical protein, variant 2 [Aphanomyces invadans]|eukprot:XP_008863474.1 hypothetical protein, variant 2 [Aphanomyces invadans]